MLNSKFILFQLFAQYCLFGFLQTGCALSAWFLSLPRLESVNMDNVNTKPIKFKLDSCLCTIKTSCKTWGQGFFPHLTKTGSCPCANEQSCFPQQHTVWTCLTKCNKKQKPTTEHTQCGNFSPYGMTFHDSLITLWASIVGDEPFDQSQLTGPHCQSLSPLLAQN